MIAIGILIGSRAWRSLLESSPHTPCEDLFKPHSESEDYFKTGARLA